MTIWNWIRAVIGTREVYYLVAYLLRALVATESPVELHFNAIRDKLLERSLIYLDVRNRNELRNGKVAGSVNIPLSELDEAFAKSDQDFLTTYGFQKPKKSAKNLVVASGTGRRAGTALQKLQKLGYGSIKIYKGSFHDWSARGGSIVKD